MRVEIVEADRARDLRRTVLRAAAGPNDALPGDDISDAVHFAALDDDGAVVSTCFIYPDAWPHPDLDPDPDPAPGPDAGERVSSGWHLRQMATDPARRGLGAGSAVVEHVIAYVEAHGGGILWCHARVPAIRFYERHGLVAVGGIHPAGDPPIAHRYMYRPPS